MSLDDARQGLEHRDVAVDLRTGQLLGWIAATATSSRAVYAGVIEHFLYVRPRHHTRGIGTALLDTLLHSAETARVWTIQTGIFPENQASLALHRKAGFTIIGTRHHIAYHRTPAQQRWRDVTLIERRIENTPSTLVT